jgi:hypothetical protein
MMRRVFFFAIGSLRCRVDRMFTTLLEALFTKAHDGCSRQQAQACLWRACIAD